MFTGLVQATGQLQSLGARHLLVRCRPSTPLLQTLAVGDSVAVEGTCLTVETLTDKGFVVTVSPETLRRTTLAGLVDTDWAVNLEPALRVGDRLGGHFMSGHVDGLGHLQSVEQAEASWEMQFRVDSTLGRLIVPKGSIAINGISLTIADCTEDGTWFKVAVIPHSFAQTNLQALAPHQAVNIETDLLGKYVAKLLQSPMPSSASASTLTPEFLVEHGFV